MSVTTYLTRDNIETLGIIVSIGAAFWAFLNSRKMTETAKEANQIAKEASEAANQSASAADSTAKASETSARIQQEQWNESRAAIFHLEGYSGAPKEHSSEQASAGLVFRFSNRGKAPALEAQMVFQAKDGETWLQIQQKPVGEIKPTRDFRLEPPISIAEYEHYTGFKLLLEYHDYDIHTDSFTFLKPRGVTSLEQPIITHDGAPHPSHLRNQPT